MDYLRVFSQTDEQLESQLRTVKNSSDNMQRQDLSGENTFEHRQSDGPQQINPKLEQE